MFAELLNGIGEFLSTTSGTLITIGAIATIGLSILGNKMKEFMLAKQQKAIEQETLKQQRLQNIAAQKSVIQAKEKHLTDLKNLKTKAQATLLDKNATKAEKAAAQQLLGTIDQQIADAEHQVEIEKNQNYFILKYNNNIYKFYKINNDLYMYETAWSCNIRKMSLNHIIKSEKTRNLIREILKAITE